VYDVYTSLACYLLTERMAEPAPENSPAAPIPIENQIRKLELFGRSKRVSLQRAIAADRARRKKR
jgi:hypothetical protein